MEVHVEEHQARLDARHVQRRHAEGHHPATRPGPGDCVPDRDRVGRGRPDLEAEVAGVAGPRDEARDPGDRGLHHPEIGEVLRLGRDGGQQVTRVWPLHGQHAPLLGHVLDRRVQAAHEPLEIGEIRLRGGEQVLVLGDVEQHAVLDDEAAVVAPQRVLRMPDGALARIASQHASQESLRVRPGDSVLV